jgi:ABC-type multidrug transport system permease subunit
MQVAAHADPVAYAVDLMRGALLGQFFFPVWLSLAVLTVVIVVLVYSGVQVLKRGEDDSSLGASKFTWK